MKEQTRQAPAMTTTLGALAWSDGLRLVRDRFLVGMVAYVLFMAVAIRFAIPWMTERFAPTFDLTPYFPLLNSYISIVTGALITGVIGGLLLLETREERTIDALRVSPLPLPRLLSAEAFFAYVGAIPFIAVTAVVVDVGLPTTTAGFVGAVVGGAAFAPVVAVSLATFSRDKVEAFAVMKGIGFIALVPVAAWFAPEPWQWFVVVVPPFAAAKAWWVAAAGGTTWIAWAIAALVVNGLALRLIIPRWHRSTAA